MVSASNLQDLAAGARVTVAIRPEAIHLAESHSSNNAVAALVEDVSFLGSIVRIRCRCDGMLVSMDLFNDPNRALPARGQSVALQLSAESLLVLRES
jgi:putative spermidine/putrescine transport system ATP-binding protein